MDNQEIRQFVERIQRLTEERSSISADISMVYVEAKSRGLETKPLRALVKLMAKRPDEREHEEATLELYRQAVGI